MASFDEQNYDQNRQEWQDKALDQIELEDDARLRAAHNNEMIPAFGGAAAVEPNAMISEGIVQPRQNNA